MRTPLGFRGRGNIKKYWIGIAVAAAIAFVGGVVWIFEGFEYLDKAVGFLIRSGTYLDPQSSLVSVKPWLEAVLIVTALVVAGLTGVVIHLLRKAPPPDNTVAAISRKLAEDHRKAQVMIGGMMAATSRIRNQLSPVGTLGKSFAYARVTYYIHKDFTAEVIREYGIVANKDAVHFWTTGNRASADAEPVDYLQDIQFEITDKKGASLPYLPIKNDALAKDVVIYFLPKIEPGTGPRDIQIAFTWPRYLRQLEKQGSESFSFTLDSIDPIPTLQFSWFLEPGTGYRLAPERVSAELPGEVLNPAASVRRSGVLWSGFSYEAKNGPPGTFKYELRARLEKA